MIACMTQSFTYKTLCQLSCRSLLLLTPSIPKTVMDKKDGNQNGLFTKQTFRIQFS